MPLYHADWYNDAPSERSPHPSILDRYAEPSSDGSEHPLDMLRDIIGDYLTIGFWRWADEHGKTEDRSWRRQVYIAAPKNIERMDSLVNEIGRLATLEICKHFGGQTIDLPNGRWVMRRQAQRLAGILDGDGVSITEIAEQVTESGNSVSDYQTKAWLRKGSSNKREDPKK